MTYHLNNGSLFLKTDIKNDFSIFRELVIWKILFIGIYRHKKKVMTKEFEHPFNVISRTQKRKNFGIRKAKNRIISEFAIFNLVII